MLTGSSLPISTCPKFTGSAKTAIWNILVNAHNSDVEKSANKTKRTCIFEPVNPKAVTGDELYGYTTLAKDRKDGVLSIIMRGMSKNVSEQGFHEHQNYKWVVLDGDIGAVWRVDEYRHGRQ